MWEWLRMADWGALQTVNGEWIHPWLDQGMVWASDFRIFIGPLILAGLGFWIWGHFRGRLLVLTMLVVVMVGDGVVMRLGKILVNRPRPHESIAGLRVVTREGARASVPQRPRRGRSFPSAHVGNNVALAIVATAIYGRIAGFLWVWVLIVSYSRIYVGSHYPSDVLGSWLLAIGYTVAILQGMEVLWRRWGSRWFPNLWQAHSKLFGIRKAS
jgi:undecaprenyl-diphosphatase